MADHQLAQRQNQAEKAPRAAHRQSSPVSGPDIITLQRTAGNAAVNALLQRKVFFAQQTGERTKPTLEQVRTWLGQGGFSISSGARTYNENPVVPAELIEQMVDDAEERTFRWAYGQADFVRAVKAVEHANWLAIEARKLDAKNRQMQGGAVVNQPLVQHEQMLDQRMKEKFAHYNFFDNNMIWRFTSFPSEFIWIAAHTSYEQIIEVTAAHSGGNDKSNQQVKTLSFGRNLGALMGTAASLGGDKHVTNIIDKAEYLYGIDIGSLEAHAVSAHPATSRSISLFETEYVLVSTPGARPLTLEDLATVKYRNPFKGSQRGFLQSVSKSSEKNLDVVEAEAKQKPAVVPETTTGLIDMSPEAIKAIMTYATAVTAAATKQSGVVQDKEAGGIEAGLKAMDSYNAQLSKVSALLTATK